MALQKKILSGAFNQEGGKFVVTVTLYDTSTGNPEPIPDFIEVPLAITGSPTLANIKDQVDQWAAKVEAFQAAKADPSFNTPW